MNKINRLKNILICPTAGDKLIYKKKIFYSNKSKKTYKIKNDKIFFSKNDDEINKFVIIKNYIKNKHGKLYYNLLKIFGPTYPYPIDREIKKVINLDDDKLICLDIGSGNLQTNKNFINLDYHPYENVNLVGDASNIPIKANSINFVYSKSFFEHAKNPKQVVNEIYMDEKVEQYIVDLVFATRRPAEYGIAELEDLISFGASPRATINLNLAARAQAFMEHRAYVTPEDVRTVALDVFRHRLIPTFEAEAEEIGAEELVQKVMNNVQVP